MKKIPEGYKKVCNLSELKDEIGKQIFIDDVEIAVFKVDGEVFALNNICPHQQTHLIHEGFIEDCKIACPVHGWKFDLKTGNLNENRRGLQSFEVKVFDNDICVKVIDKKINW
jgi:NAD(P)H-dependent nitrite reductase small subunit